jgi:phosphoglycerol transferase MdoB-like AlkP superfamily enzyme
VLPALLGLGLVVATYGALLRRWALSGPLGPVATVTSRGRRVALGALLTVVYVLGIYGKWSWYPLRWSEAFDGPNTFLSALALNPVLFAFDTLPDRAAPPDLARIEASYDEIAELLEVDRPDPQRRSFLRRVEPGAGPGFTPNLVVIHLEAFAGHKTSALGNALDSSPAFDRIARESMLFTHFFVPTAPTARSVFTMLTGIPDVNPVRSASRNPRLVEQRTLVNALAGYEKLYFLGGSATWANIRGLLAHNIPGLRMYEEGDYEAPRLNVWGVSDLDLFDRAHEVLSLERAPFFAFIQTAGNHGPYSIPEDRRGFELVDLDPETVRKNGFPSLEAYNSFRLLDYSLGRFFRLARESPYFDRTVFVMYGDHGAPSPWPTPWEQLGLTYYHVPLAIHVPWRPELAARVGHVASLVDLLPTCLSLMGRPYTNATLGRDLLAPRPAAERFAFLGDGLVTEDYLLKVDPVGRGHLHAYRSETPLTDLAATLPDETARLLARYGLLHDTSQYLLHHNAPFDSEGAGIAVAAERVGRVGP